jgi:hypothetical protein
MDPLSTRPLHPAIPHTPSLSHSPPSLSSQVMHRTLAGMQACFGVSLAVRQHAFQSPHEKKQRMTAQQVEKERKSGMPSRRARKKAERGGGNATAPRRLGGRGRGVSVLLDKGRGRGEGAGKKGTLYSTPPSLARSLRFSASTLRRLADLLSAVLFAANARFLR